MSKQILLTVRGCEQKNGEAEEIKLLHNTNQTVLATMREGGFKLPSLCGVNGKCGKCMIKFKGTAPLPTPSERIWLAPDQLRDGFRLACMAKPVTDSVVETAFLKDAEIAIVVENKLEKELDLNGAAEVQKVRHQMHGYCTPEIETFAAVDLGTTTIVMQLVECITGKIWDTYTCLNPQSVYGADVISRIQAGSEGGGERLRKLVIDALESGMRQLEESAIGNKLCKPTKIMIAGNTVMGHLLLGYPVKSLGECPFIPINIGEIEFELMGRHAVLIPGISAFVGGDVVSGLYAMGLHNMNTDKNENWLFLDLGTNAEMAAGDERHIFCTAAAAGPAFESKGERKDIGTARIQATAKLLEKGRMDSTGLLQDAYFEDGIECDGILITQKDIREIQTAKAAVRSGIHYLKEKMGWSSYDEIDKVYLAGGFGFYLDKESAARIGLIPCLLKDKIMTVGNTALAGAVLYGQKSHKDHEDEESRILEDIANEALFFNLAGEQDFEKTYIGYIDFE